MLDVEKVHQERYQMMDNFTEFASERSALVRGVAALRPYDTAAVEPTLDADTVIG
jgi:hypothetical protein